MLVAGKELRETLRDRRTLAVMVLFPLVVYPLVSLITAQVMAVRATREDAAVARVAVERTGRRSPTRCGRGWRRGAICSSCPPRRAADIAAERVDAIVELARNAGTKDGKPATARVLFDETRGSSRAAHERVEQALAGAGADVRPRLHRHPRGDRAPHQPRGLRAVDASCL